MLGHESEYLNFDVPEIPSYKQRVSLKSKTQSAFAVTVQTCLNRPGYVKKVILEETK